MKKAILALAIYSLFIYIGGMAGIGGMTGAWAEGYTPDLWRRADLQDMNRWVDSVMMTLDTPEKQLGQLFMPQYVKPNPQQKDLNAIAKDIREMHLGGVLLSKGTLATHAQVVNAVQGEAKKRGLPPLLVAMDCEWGLAMRLSDAIKYPRNGAIGKIAEPERDSICYRYGQELARQCRMMGIQVAFGPDMDVNSNPKNPVIGNRSYGSDPQTVTRCGLLFSRGLEDGGVMSVSKHFPGHGDTDTDSHKTLPLLKHNRARLDSIELAPFRAYAAAGLSGIMTAHLDVPALAEKRGMPATASRKIITGLLRNELGFEGLVFTDGLAMQGARAYPDICIEALKAGNDILVQPFPIREQWNNLTAALKSGKLDRKLVEEKCRKVLCWKYILGLNETPAAIDTHNLTERINTPEALAFRDEMVRLTEHPGAAPQPAHDKPTAQPAHDKPAAQPTTPVDYDPTLQADEVVEKGDTQQPARPSKGIDKEDGRFKAIDSIAMEGIRKGAYPGCQILVARHGEILYSKAFGWLDHHHKEAVTTDTYYDLASLSKTVGMLPAVMALVSDGDIKLNTRLSSQIAELKGTDKSQTTVMDCLYHRTGLASGYPFYKQTLDTASYGGKSYYKGRKESPYTVQQGVNTWFHEDLDFDPNLVSKQADARHPYAIAKGLYIAQSFEDSILAKIVGMKLKRPGRYLYSDLNFVLLRVLTERMKGMRLDQFLEEKMPEFFGQQKLCYNPLEHGIALEQIAPTEEDNALRHQTLRGYVHDETSAWRGGVEGNAGVFGSAEKLYPLLQMYLSQGAWGGRQILNAQTVKTFTTSKCPTSRRGLGFDKPEPNPAKYSPCASECSPATFGHTGFTGTCWWIDPKEDLIYIFLSNRINPHRWNRELMDGRYRERIQSAIYEAIK